MKNLVLAAALAGAAIAPAYAASFGCRAPVVGKCVCTENINPKSALGYNATDDKQSVPVDIVCIDEAMNVTYPRTVVRKEDGLGASYTGVHVPHAGDDYVEPVSDPWRR